MKNLFGFIGIVALCLGVLISCSKNDSTSSECSAVPASAVMPADGTVDYYVTSTDSAAKIKSIVYQGTNGPVTLGNTLFPFKLSVFLKTGSPIGISAVGTANGTFTSGYFYSNGIDTLAKNASCSR